MALQQCGRVTLRKIFGLNCKNNLVFLHFRPLDAFCASGMGLVAYDDDDAMSPVPSPQQQTSEALSSSSQPVNEPMSDTRRQALREIEVKVLKYQDELESAKRRGDSVTSENAIKQVS